MMMSLKKGEGKKKTFNPPPPGGFLLEQINEQTL